MTHGADYKVALNNGIGESSVGETVVNVVQRECVQQLSTTSLKSMDQGQDAAGPAAREKRCKYLFVSNYSTDFALTPCPLTP